MSAPTVAAHSATQVGPCGHHGCPLVDPDARAAYRSSIEHASEFSLRSKEFLLGLEPKDQATWLQAAVARSRDLFQPWTMEILYLTAVHGTTRFSILERLTGMSSRTLSNKLRALTDQGFLDRIVHDTQPVRIEYTVTKTGRTLAALASPLFAFLNETPGDADRANRPASDTPPPTPDAP